MVRFALGLASATVIATAFIATAPVGAHARDRTETCASYRRATGTVVTDCRSPGHHERHCESHQHATGTVTTECR
jgi:hypothetical protein